MNVPLIAVALLLLGFPALRVQAQAPAAGPSPAGAPSENASALATTPSSPIEAITVTGSQKFPANQIIAASGLKVGDAVTAKELQDAANRLAALGVFSNVNYRYTTKGKSLSLEFKVREAPTYPVDFDNFPWFTDQEIGDAIRQRVGLFDGQAPEGGTLVDQMTTVIAELVASKGVTPNITHQLLAAPVGDGSIVQFRVEGPPLRIFSVEFTDPIASGSERLKDRVPDIKGQPYSRFAIQVFESEQVRPLYISQGFLRAQIGPPQTHLVPDPYNPKQESVNVTIPIETGAAYTWGGVNWQGNTAFDATNLNGSADIKTGGVADGLEIEGLWQNIEAEYRRHGYLDMKLVAQPQFDDTSHSVSYVARITEGAQYRMGSMVITGLSVEAEKRLRESWQIAPGEVFNDGYYERKLKLLEHPSREIFGSLPVHYNEFGHWLRPDTSRHTVDVLLDFK